MILAGSRHVIASLRAAGIRRVHPEPLYAVAQMDRVGAGSEPLRARSRYDWDRRKLRDRTLGALEPLWRGFLPKRRTRAQRAALGVVSRSRRSSNFPLLFAHLAPVLAVIPRCSLRYSAAALCVGLISIGRFARCAKSALLGHQRDVGACTEHRFPADGLPEKEALGLNVIEAQACGTAVIAPDAPPFDETSCTGLRACAYRDPARTQAGF